MWQHRQEDRNLKRAEMDLIKQKRQVQRSMKAYEASESSHTPSHRYSLESSQQAKSNGHTQHPPCHTPLTFDPYSSVYLELSQQQSDEADLLQGKERALEQYWQKDLHRRKEETKSRVQAVLVGRQRLNAVTKKSIKTE